MATRGERDAAIWASIAEHAAGAPVTFEHLCRAAVTGIGVDGAAVTTAGGASRETLHATDTIAADLEEWQITYGEGACVDALGRGAPVLVEDLRTSSCGDDWPIFAPAALASGARAVFAFPLQVGAIQLGVLGLYRARPGGLYDRALASALGFADAALVLLLDAADDPTRFDDSMAHVHQATGMVLAQLGVNAETAFARLRAYAFTNDRRLGDVAWDVVHRRLRFEPDRPEAAPDG